MSEKKRQTKIMNWLRKDLRKGHWIKITQGRFSLPGVSDILGCYLGGFFAFEIKSAIGKLTVPQKIFIKLIRKAGGQAYMVRSVEEVKEIINEYTLRIRACTCVCHTRMECHSNQARQ